MTREDAMRDEVLREAAGVCMSLAAWWQDKADAAEVDGDSQPLEHYGWAAKSLAAHTCAVRLLSMMGGDK